MKVLYVTNLPAPYKIAFFNELAKKVELTVVYERRIATNRDKDWKSNDKASFEEVYLDGRNIGEESSYSNGVIKLLKQRDFDTVIMNGFSSPTEMVTIAYMRYRKIHYGIMCDGMLPGKNNIVKKTLKKYLLLKAEYYLCSNQVTAEVLIGMGVKETKIYMYPFSSISKKDIENQEYDKEKYKKEIGFNEKKVFLFVGQFIHRKGIDILLSAYEKTIIDNKDAQMVLLLIGGESLPYPLSEKIKDNVKIIGFKKNKELQSYYKAADILILPTREDIWGLVVNEAFAAGIPVITTDRCGAGLEMIKNDVTGCIIPSENMDVLADKINSYIDGKSLYLRNKIIETARYYTIENMAEKTFESLKLVVKER